MTLTSRTLVRVGACTRKPLASDRTQLSTLPTLDEKVRFLSTAGNLPDSSKHVVSIETHMSWVFLAGRLAWKLKKPVVYPFLDFRRIDDRRHYCEEELRLNRRLAPEVYLGIDALVVDAHGRLAFDAHEHLAFDARSDRDGAGQNTIVDWLVRMRRLDRNRMLDRLIELGANTEPMMDALASRLGRFYLTLVPARIDALAYVARLHDDLERTCDALRDPVFALAPDNVETLRSRQRIALERLHGLAGERVEQGRIVEGHGDLRPEHVCFESPCDPIVIDGLEFNARLRTLDSADDLAFLTLECERLGAPGAHERIFAGVARITGDRAPAALVHYYQSVRASMRAGLALAHLHELGAGERERIEHWRTRAARYLQLATAHAVRAQG